MFYCVAAQRFVSPSLPQKRPTAGPSHTQVIMALGATEHYSGFAKERLMFIIIAINGITVIVVIIHCLLEMSVLWSFETFHCFPCSVQNSQLLTLQGNKEKSETMAFPCTSFGATGLGFLFAKIDKRAGKNSVFANVKLASLKE